MMKQSGRIVSYGATAGAPKPFVMANIFLDVKGTAMCSPQEFSDMVGFVERQKIVPVVDVVKPLGEVNEAIERVRKGGQFGKIVLVVKDAGGSAKAKL
ncbi:putative zinc-type alcohol dehydrogenase-like protein YogA [Diplonema papillatum]|nr:putative zinc-type alcohol dehydrogenase-like protein YogA [Diplonema papillatum]